MDVPVEVNRLVFEYDELIIIGPVFPHEVVGCSGGNKYLFPGVGGPRILNFFHWLGAVVTNPMIIGNKWTPVRRVVDRAGAMVKVPKLASAWYDGPGLAGIYAGTPETAWDAASELCRQLHITRKDHPFNTILSCCPPMYEDVWTGGKCMYKLEPVLADGGELIIYAPHIREVSVTHGRDLCWKSATIAAIISCKQWDRFKDYPWGVLAHSTHVYGLGTYENGVETPRARVILATSIPEEVCRKINLGYRDPKTIRKEDFAGREDKGILLVPKAGEMLFQLKNSPPGRSERRRDEKKPALPFVFLNVAMTADGKIAPASRHFEPFGGPRDRQHLLELRATADAVMAGARTVDLDRVKLGPGPARYRRLRTAARPGGIQLARHRQRRGHHRSQAEIFKHRFSPIIILTTGRVAKSRLTRLRTLADEVKICGKKAN